jgi:alpha-D-ribose 1-methylphosphonate 5-triphosphate diphosphatase PhnM
MNNWQKRIIEENIPGFDFEKSRDGQEMQSVIKVAVKKAEKKRKTTAFEKALEMGFKEGISIESHDGSQKETVKKVSSDGHLILEGRKGSFNICGWKVIA